MTASSRMTRLKPRQSSSRLSAAMFKACPRCNGDLMLDGDDRDGGEFSTCIQCGWEGEDSMESLPSRVSP